MDRRHFLAVSGGTVGSVALGTRSVLSGAAQRDQSSEKPRRNNSPQEDAAQRENGSGSMYTVITTTPPYGSRNVGDKLIEHRTKEIFRKEKNATKFLTVFREEPLEEHLETVNASRGILMPAFPIRDNPMYPVTVRLVKDLSRIKVPLIPVGANWNVYPGDVQSRREVQYSKETVDFLRYVAGQIKHISCREYYVVQVLKKHGITNTIMTGDPAWFDLQSLGKPMRRPSEIKRVVFTPPLSPYYADQAAALMTMIAEQFPAAERLCGMHLADAETSDTTKAENSAALSPAVTAKNRRIRQLADKLDFQVLELAGDLEALSRHYDRSDLHVGYEAHAHVYLLSKRRPSVLIAEDARGVGFNYTLGVGGFSGFTRAQAASASQRKTITSGYCTSLDELALAPPRTDVHEAVRSFLEEELASGFRRYLGLPAFLDDTYAQVMQPFVRSLP